MIKVKIHKTEQDKYWRCYIMRFFIWWEIGKFDNLNKAFNFIKRLIRTQK